MARKSKLLAALDSQKGRDFNLEKQKKLQKQAVKRKRSKACPEGQQTVEDEREDVKIVTQNSRIRAEAENDGWESGESEAALLGNIEASMPMEDESDSDSSLEHIPTKLVPPERLDPRTNPDSSQEDEDEGQDIALSDIESLASDEKADILPHQRLTINNTTALLLAHKSIALPSSLPFSAHQTLTTSNPVDIADVNDDLNRELAFYKQCLDAANEGRSLLKKEGIPFSRPNDFFAEMVKNDEHMGKIKQKMVDDAASKKASSEARRQRDLKKFGKQVQVAKEQERAKEKRATLDKINLLKRKRKNTDTGTTNEEDLFDVALEDAATENKQSRSVRKGGDSKGPNKKRKDEKFGYGGKKRFSKSGDAMSTGDMSGFSAKKMKGKKSGAKRLGKSRRGKAP